MATSKRKTNIPLKVTETEIVEVMLDIDDYYWRTVKQLDILGADITNNLRAYITSYKEFEEVEDIVNSLTIVAQKHKYTHPEYRRELERIDYHLSALAEINEKISLKEWPTDNQGNPTRLSMYLETILWHVPWRSK